MNTMPVHCLFIQDVLCIVCNANRNRVVRVSTHS